MKYIDIHSHLNLKPLKQDEEQVIVRMVEHEVGTITIGVDYETSCEAVALAQKYDFVWAGVGMHPTDNTTEEFEIEKYKALATNPRVVCVGECGVDYYRDQSAETKQRQEKLFRQHIEIAKAVGKPELIVDQDVEQLLGLPFMAQVEVNEKDSGKEDKDGEPIIYRNVNYKGCAEVPLDDDDQPLPVAELKQPPRCITFDNATVDDIKYLRKKIIEMIKLANDYSGSQMEKAIKAFEAKQGGAKAVPEDDDDGDEEVDAPPPKPAVKATKPKAKPAPVEEDDDDSNSPF
jgi:hypothetical protein